MVYKRGMNPNSRKGSPFIKGHKSYHTKEGDLKISRILKRHWKELKEKNPESLQKRNEKISKFHKGKILSEETRKKVGDFHRGKKLSKEHKQKLKDNHKGMLGKNHSKKTKLKMSKLKLGIPHSQEHIKKILRSLHNRPTSYEKRISELCIEYNLPFIYCGDGTFLIGHKNPDFVDKEMKVAIEVYYDYYKIRDFGSCENYEKQRSKYFAKYGYKTIFIRKKHIENKNWKNICLNLLK